MEQYLDKIVKYLVSVPVTLSHGITSGRDGRVDSILNEDEIIKHLLKNPDFSPIIEIPPMRDFCDFILYVGDQRIYVNIKVSDFSNKSADNCSSKEGMAYALTGGRPASVQFGPFHEYLVHNLRPGYDYYFLVVNKLDSRDVYWTSLKRIKKLVPNGNNLPFQCDWSANREPSGRNEVEATRYILETYLASWNKKIQGYPTALRDLLNHP